MAKKKRKTSNVILVILGVFYLFFIALMVVIFLWKGAIPDTLVQCTMGAGGIEAVALSAIKVSKELSKKKKTNAEMQE